jgi:hypothetical protein
MTMTLITAHGHTGTVHFDGAFVTIERSGFKARATVGKGEKRIPLGSITAVQFQDAGRVGNGHIAFSLLGAVETTSGGRQGLAAVRDPNAVVFTRKQAAEFAALRAAIEQGIAARTGS